MALARAPKTAENNDDRRVLSAASAYTDAAHYERLAQLDGLDDYAREFALRNAECVALLKKAAAQ
jgi:hypothetical protein